MPAGGGRATRSASRAAPTRRSHRKRTRSAVPGRDCSQSSAGGAPSEQAYKDWVDAFERTAAYIDAGHSAWQPLEDYDAGFGEPRMQLGMTNRLKRGGIAKADGFFLNVSNYRTTADLIDYGTRLSATVGNAHFVLDTSRNGQGHWTPPAGVYSDPQDWCNPPGRGLGLRPTTRTGNRLIDAFLWVKRPGESDGQCTRGTAGPEDPEYGQVDPPAGAWWPEYALGLAQRANPPLR